MDMTKKTHLKKCKMNKKKHTLVQAHYYAKKVFKHYGAAASRAPASAAAKRRMAEAAGERFNEKLNEHGHDIVSMKVSWPEDAKCRGRAHHACRICRQTAKGIICQITRDKERNMPPKVCKQVKFDEKDIKNWCPRIEWWENMCGASTENETIMAEAYGMTDTEVAVRRKHMRNSRA